MMEYLKKVWEVGWAYWLVNGALVWIMKLVFLDLPRYILSPSYRERVRDEQAALASEYAKRPKPIQLPKQHDEYLAFKKDGTPDPLGPCKSAGTARERAGEGGRVEWRKSFRFL
jgi:hypothetical protein